MRGVYAPIFTSFADGLGPITYRVFDERGRFCKDVGKISLDEFKKCLKGS